MKRARRHPSRPAVKPPEVLTCVLTGRDGFQRTVHTEGFALRIIIPVLTETSSVQQFDDRLVVTSPEFSARQFAFERWDSPYPGGVVFYYDEVPA